MTNVRVSVCICTHAPDFDVLSRVITALSVQTLDPRLWELLLVENAPRQTCEASCLSGLPCRYKLMLEPQPGKVRAMAAAAREVSGDWVVFVDDDNVLDPDYLETVLSISTDHPKLGVLSASIQGEFEVEVPEWARPFLPYLAVRPLEQEVWANFVAPHVGPIGAAMCVRREVYDRFAEDVVSGRIDPAQGRSAGSLAAGTDDTVFMSLAFEAGLGCGAFPELKMTHLIGRDRLEVDYLERLVRDISRSHAQLLPQASHRRGWRFKSRLREALTWMRFKGERRRIELARIRGRRSGLDSMAESGVSRGA